MSRRPDVLARIEEKHGDNVTKVRDYYQLNCKNVEILDVSPFIGRNV